MKKFRYRKITPQILGEMKQLRESGLTYKAIAEKFNVDSSTAQYWLSPQERENSIKRGMKDYEKLTQEQKKEKNKKSYEYKKEYLLERYRNDEEFKKRYIKYVRNSFAKRRKGWLIAELCSNCGRERKDKKWKQCEKCREKGRERERWKIKHTKR